MFIRRNRVEFSILILIVCFVKISLVSCQNSIQSRPNSVPVQHEDRRYVKYSRKYPSTNPNEDYVEDIVEYFDTMIPPPLYGSSETEIVKFLELDEKLRKKVSSTEKTVDRQISQASPTPIKLHSTESSNSGDVLVKPKITVHVSPGPENNIIFRIPKIQGKINYTDDYYDEYDHKNLSTTTTTTAITESTTKPSKWSFYPSLKTTFVGNYKTTVRSPPTPSTDLPLINYSSSQTNLATEIKKEEKKEQGKKEEESEYEDDEYDQNEHKEEEKEKEKTEKEENDDEEYEEVEEEESIDSTDSPFFKTPSTPKKSANDIENFGDGDEEDENGKSTQDEKYDDDTHNYVNGEIEENIEEKTTQLPTKPPLARSFFNIFGK